MRRTRAGKIVIAVLTVGALIVAAVMPSVAGAHESGDQIGVCCAWSSGPLANDDLTYKISGGSATLRQRAADGVENWEEHLSGDLTFSPVSGNTKADVTIKLTRGGSPFVAGQTGLKFQLDRTARAFFIKGASITIFGARDDIDDADEIEYVAAHEFGHALGAGHANAAGYLMSPSLPPVISSTDPTDCDSDAVEAANQWYFNGDTSASLPGVDHVHC